MWQAYLTVIRKKASQAIPVLDRFHVMQLLLKRPENLTDNQAVCLVDLPPEEVVRFASQENPQ